MIERTAIIGDIHGTISEFKELLTLLDYKSPNVRVILLGDLNDRGPDSPACVKLARELGLECVTGNHEKKYLNWYRNQGSGSDVHGKNYPSYYDQFSNEDINYIARMVPYIKIEEQNTVIVHAGLRAGIPLEKQSKEDLFYIRYVDDQNKFVSLRKINKLGSKEAAGAHFWTEYGPWGFNIIYGHNVNSLTDIRVDSFSDGTACYGIDTGCCFGGNLTAIILETKEIIQVKAKQIYYKSNFDIR